MGLSIKPSEMGSGGGLWSDIDANIIGARFIMTNFGGSAPTKIPAFELKVVDDEGEEHEQILSAGRGKFAPSEDGTTLEGDGKLNVGSNFGLFITSLVNAGFPENKLEDDISVLLGMRAHFERVPAPKRSGIVKAPRADGKVYEDTILTVTKIHVLPWEAGKKKGTAAGKAPVAGKKGAQAADAFDVPGAAMDAIIEVLSANPNGLTKQQLAARVFKTVANTPEQAEIVKMCYDDEFMSSGPWSVSAKGIVSM